METKAITEEMRIKLRESFPDEAYSAHPTKTFLTTLKAMYVTERLNDVFGVGRWTITHNVEERTADYILIRGEFNSLDYEVITPAQFGGHGTTGKNTEIADGYKSAVTDCISKIASYLEIGIDMFKGKINVPKGGGNTYKKPDTKTVTKTLTQPEVDNKWNGKIYSNKFVYIDNVKCQIPQEQIDKLKTLPKYKKDETN